MFREGAMVTLTIDGKKITADKNTTILKAALENGIVIGLQCVAGNEPFADRTFYEHRAVPVVPVRIQNNLCIFIRDVEGMIVTV